MVAVVTPTSETGGKKSSSCLFSCFRASPVLDLAETEASVDPAAGRKPGRSRFRDKKKTVAVNTSVVADVGATPARPTPPEAAPGGDHATKEEVSKRKSAGRKSFFQKYFHKDESNKDYKSTSHHHHPTRTVPTQSSPVRHITSKSRTQPEPAHLYRVHDRTQIGTLTSHPGSPEGHPRASSHKKSLSKHTKNSNEGFNFDSDSDSFYGLLIVMMVLGLLVFCGRVPAVVCMCTWFYLLPRIKRSSGSTAIGIGRRGEDRVDTSSEEYKKMVVLKGLLERDGRRTLRSNLAGAQ